MSSQHIYSGKKEITGKGEFFPRAVFFGDGVFETMRWKNSPPVFLNNHLDRISRGAAILEITPPSYEKITDEIADAVKQSGFADCVVKVCVISDADAVPFFARADGCRMVVSVTSIEKGTEKLPLKLTVADGAYARYAHPLSSIKSLNYLENVIAMRNAAKHGFDDALFLSSDGFVTETACRNIFWGKGSEIFTPPENCGILAGITRGILIATARVEGFSVSERSAKLTDLTDTEFVFTTNSVSGINPVEKILHQDLTLTFSTQLNRTYDKIKTLLFQALNW